MLEFRCFILVFSSISIRFSPREDCFEELFWYLPFSRFHHFLGLYSFVWESPLPWFVHILMRCLSSLGCWTPSHNNHPSIYHLFLMFLSKNQSGLSDIGCRVDIYILAASCPNLAPSPVLALNCEFYPRKVLGAYLK